MTMNNDTMRQGFEAAMTDGYDFIRDTHGMYVKPDTFEAYEGWQAASLRHEKDMEELMEVRAALLHIAVGPSDLLDTVAYAKRAINTLDNILAGQVMGESGQPGSVCSTTSQNTDEARMQSATVSSPSPATYWEIAFKRLSAEHDALLVSKVMPIDEKGLQAGIVAVKDALIKGMKQQVILYDSLEEAFLEAYEAARAERRLTDSGDE